MNFKEFAHHFYQSSQGILVELTYSLTIILASLGVIYFVLILKWFSSQL